jgi:anti-sigma regulatory factor (Ser/Thr protein kinase)
MARQVTTKILQKDFPSDRKKRQIVVETVVKAISKENLKTEVSNEELYLIIDEAVTNAMEHGNHWNPQKKIAIDVEINSKSLIIKITDEGQGFNTSNIKDNLKNRNVLSTRGRGIFIINQFCHLTWNNRGNQVQLKIKLIN